MEHWPGGEPQPVIPYATPAARAERPMPAWRVWIAVLVLVVGIGGGAIAIRQGDRANTDLRRHDRRHELEDRQARGALGGTDAAELRLLQDEAAKERVERLGKP